MGSQNIFRDHFNNLIGKIAESLGLGTFLVATEFNSIDLVFTL